MKPHNMLEDEIGLNWLFEGRPIDNLLQDEESPIVDIFVAGQNVATDSIDKFTKALLKRDYLNVKNFNGFNDSDVGVICIPETYLPDAPKILEPAKSIAEDVVVANLNVVLENPNLAVCTY